MATTPSTRHLLLTRDLADSRYFEQLSVAELARAAGLSKAHFTGEFSRTFR
jgi:AraC-like DNA-binding protein